MLPAEGQALVLERAGGNPLYAEEFVRTLNDRELLVQRGRTLAPAPGEAVTWSAALTGRCDRSLDGNANRSPKRWRGRWRPLPRFLGCGSRPLRERGRPASIVHESGPASSPISSGAGISPTNEPARSENSCVCGFRWSRRSERRLIALSV